MSFKIVQTVNQVTVTAGAASSSNAIALQSGYIRVSCAATAAYVAIGTNPVATVNDFMIVPNSSEVLKQRVARQGVSGITTGTSTIISFEQNSGNPFVVGDYVTILNGYPAGINTTHSPILSTTDSSITLNWNSSAVTGIALTGTTVARSVKVSAFSPAATSISIAEVQTASLN
jgi:hypothetical protein